MSNQQQSSNQSGPMFSADAAVVAVAEIDAPWAAVAAVAADAKLGLNTLVLEVGDAISVTEQFVITSGNNSRQVKAICNDIEHQVKLVGGPSPVRLEGLESLDWVLMDYGFFVVHVFSAEAREYYQLERLWKDCEKLDWRSLIPVDLRPPEPQPESMLAESVDSADSDTTGDPVVDNATW